MDAGRRPDAGSEAGARVRRDERPKIIGTRVWQRYEIVLEGTIELRRPDGTEEARRGDLVCFPPGAAGAHKTTNRGSEPARILMFSSAHEPAVAVYPDSDKVGVWTPDDQDRIMVRRGEAHLDYWNGER